MANPTYEEIIQRGGKNVTSRFKEPSYEEIIQRGGKNVTSRFKEPSYEEIIQRGGKNVTAEFIPQPPAPIPQPPARQYEAYGIVSPEDSMFPEQYMGQPPENIPHTPAMVTEAVPPGVARVQVPGMTTQPQTTEQAESWPKIIGKSAMGGLAAIGTGVIGGMKLFDEAIGIDASNLDRIAKVATDYWTPKVGDSQAKKYAAAITQSMMTSTPMMMLGPAALPAFGVTSGGNKYIQLREAGKGVLNSMTAAIPVGLSEALTEKLPLDKIMDITLPIARRIALSAGLEVPGEIINTIVEDVVDHVSGMKELSWHKLNQDIVDTVVTTLGQSVLTAGAIHGLTRKGTPAAEEQPTAPAPEAPPPPGPTPPPVAPPPVSPVTPPAPKPLIHEMTMEEFRAAQGLPPDQPHKAYDAAHAVAVMEAAEQGLPIPEKVRAQYPEEIANIEAGKKPLPPGTAPPPSPPTPPPVTPVAPEPTSPAPTPTVPEVKPSVPPPEVPVPAPRPVAVEAAPPVAKQPWEMTRGEFSKEFWLHGRGETHPRYGQGTTIGGITKSADEARGFARVRTDRLPGVGEISLIRSKDIPSDFIENIEGKSSYSPIRSIEWKVSESIPGNIKDPHRYLVEQALASGKPVPPEVLAEYPELTTPAPISESSSDTLPPEYEVLKSISDRLNRKPYNPDIVTEKAKKPPLKKDSSQKVDFPA